MTSELDEFIDRIVMTVSEPAQAQRVLLALSTFLEGIGRRDLARYTDEHTDSFVEALWTTD